MKKIIAIVLLTAFIAGAAFAQVAGYGRIRLNFGADIPLSENPDVKWVFVPTARLGLRGGNDTVSFFAQADLNTRNVLGTWRANATVKFSEMALSIGQNELPWIQWSSLALYGDQNSGFGISQSTVDPYLRFDFFGAYVGINSGNLMVNGAIVKDFPIPGIFAGYDYKAETFSVGLAFAGLVNKKDEDVFSWMGNVHAKINAAPAVIGLNFAFYGAPQFGFFNLNGGEGIQNGKDALVIEAMIDTSFKFTPCTLAFTGAIISNVAEKEKNGGGNALKFGLCSSFDIGGGFRFIPGVMLTHFISGPGGVKYKDAEKTTMQAGTTFLYQF